MYQSESFFVEAQNDKTRFSPSITSAYQILADKSYYHICDENEKERYPDNTIAFIRCTHGEGKFWFPYEEKEYHIALKYNYEGLTILQNIKPFLKFGDTDGSTFQQPELPTLNLIKNTPLR